jgi:hypothetical protein
MTDERTSETETVDPDPLTVTLYNLRTELLFIDEYRCQFEALRGSDPQTAEEMLSALAGTTSTAKDLYSELVNLLLAGRKIDRSQPLSCKLHFPRHKD